MVTKSIGKTRGQYNVHPPPPLRNHQKTALERLREKPEAFSLFMEMGTGKTATILAEWGERTLSGDTPDLLVIAPAGAYRNWWADRGENRPSELKKHLDVDLYKKVLIYGWISGMGATAKNKLKQFLDSRQPRAFFVNIEAISSVEKARQAIIDFMAPGRTMLVIDESSRIRTPDSARTDWLVRVSGKAKSRRIMSGLPTPKAPTDLFSQMEFLDVRILGHRSYFTFRQHYAVMRQIRTGQLKKLKSGKTVPATAWVDVAYRNEEELAARIAPHSYRILKSECLDLPPKLYMPPREVEMTDEQAKAYRELVSQATTELECGAAVSPKRKITQILRLHQVLQGFVKSDDGVIRYIKSNRIRALLEVLEEAAGKVVIWVSYDESVRAVTEALEREYGPGSVARYWGGNLKTRHEDEVRYLGDPRCRFMVSTPAAGGIGNTWVVGQLAVYLSGTPDLEHRLQSEDRTHRDGQTGQATYQDFYVPGTVDERIMEINREKIDMASALLGDGYREWLQWR